MKVATCILRIILVNSAVVMREDIKGRIINFAVGLNVLSVKFPYLWYKLLFLIKKNVL